MMPLEYIVVHCSDSPNDLNDGRFDSAGAIHKWHQEKGWAGIGYSYVIDEKGAIANGRPVFPDTKEWWMGAHVRGHNHHSIGICLIGQSHFHKDQLDALRDQLDYLKAIWPEAEIVGHRDLDPKKTCPNFSVKTWLKTGRQNP